MTSQTMSVRSAKPKLAATRDNAIDFTKGILVLFMVLYHWLNYFIATQGQFYNYLRFLTPSFIFITGFMISQIHIRKYGTNNLRLPGRLLSRGVKLLAVFVGLNLLIILSPAGASARRVFIGSSLPDTLFSVFATGNITAYEGQKTASFGILLVIAYLLILSAGLTVLSRHVKFAFHYTLGLLILGVSLLRLDGAASANLDLLMTGILGVVFGYAKRAQITAVAGHNYLLCAIYPIYLAAITIWDVTLPVQVMGVVLTTTLVYVAGQRMRSPHMITDRAILLGKYSLFGYISQIAILQVLRRAFGVSEHNVMGLAASLFLAFAITVLGVELLDWARERSRAVNYVYAAVFG